MPDQVNPRYWDTQHVRAFYRGRLERFGISAAAVAWSDAAGQAARLRAIMSLADFRQRSVLDAGCGLTDLHRALLADGISHTYLGIDSSIELLLAARQRDASVNVICADVESMPFNTRFDVVVASGLFFLQSPEFRVRVLSKLYGLTREVLIYNLLSSRGASKIPDLFRTDPVIALAEAFALCDMVAFRHDYLPHDLAIALRRAG